MTYHVFVTGSYGADVLVLDTLEDVRTAIKNMPNEEDDTSVVCIIKGGKEVSELEVRL